MSDDMTLAYAFPDASPSFVHGYEAGALSARMEAGEQTIDCGYYENFPLHSANAELFRRMAAHYGYTIEVEGVVIDGAPLSEWIGVRFARCSRPVVKLALV